MKVFPVTGAQVGKIDGASLGEAEVRELVDFRLAQAGFAGQDAMFTDEAIKLIWEHTQGYPRKVTLLCHNALVSLVMYDKQQVDGAVVQAVIEQDKHASEFDALEGNLAVGV